MIGDDGKPVPLTDWTLHYENVAPRHERLREALCTLGNGYFATRGAAPESHADGVHYPATYIAGCFSELRTEIVGHVSAWPARPTAPHLAALSTPGSLPRANRERAFDEFVEALRSDVADVQGGTTAEGMHLAAMAGTVAHACYAKHALDIPIFA